MPGLCPHNLAVINATGMCCPCRKIPVPFTPVFLSFELFLCSSLYYQKTNFFFGGSDSPTLQVNGKGGGKFNTSLIKSCFNMEMKFMKPLQNCLKNAVSELLKLGNRVLTH